MASGSTSIADGYSPVYHDESLSKFGATFVATGKDAAYVEYAITGGSCGGAVDMFHTFTDPEHRGKGLAGQVLGWALEHCKQRGFRVIPTCSYVAHYIKKRPQWSELVVASSASDSAAGSSTSGSAAGSSTSGSAACSSTSGSAAGSSTGGSAAGSSTSGSAAGSSTSGSAAGSSTSGSAAGSSTSGSAAGSSTAASETSLSDVHHSDHMFVLSYTQYAKQVYISGQWPTEDTPALSTLDKDARPSFGARLASLCWRRAVELESTVHHTDSASSHVLPVTRSPDSLRLEAAHLLSLLAELHSDMEWVASDTSAVVNDLETRGFLLDFPDAQAAVSHKHEDEADEDEDEDEDAVASSVALEVEAPTPTEPSKRSKT